MKGEERLFEWLKRPPSKRCNYQSNKINSAFVNDFWSCVGIERPKINIGSSHKSTEFIKNFLCKGKDTEINVLSQQENNLPSVISLTKMTDHSHNIQSKFVSNESVPSIWIMRSHYMLAYFLSLCHQEKFNIDPECDYQYSNQTQQCSYPHRHCVDVAPDPFLYFHHDSTNNNCTMQTNSQISTSEISETLNSAEKVIDILNYHLQRYLNKVYEKRRQAPSSLPSSLNIKNAFVSLSIQCMEKGLLEEGCIIYAPPKTWKFISKEEKQKAIQEPWRNEKWYLDSLKKVDPSDLKDIFDPQDSSVTCHQASHPNSSFIIGYITSGGYR